MVAPAEIDPEDPREIAVPLIVIDELDKDEFGIDVNPVPDPANTVAANVPVNVAVLVDWTILRPNAVMDQGAIDSTPVSLAPELNINNWSPDCTIGL